jgi:tetratricopeptide (TPR) repeat protein
LEADREPDAMVTLIEGDVTFDSINLDNPTQFDDTCWIHVFTGNLTVTGAIYNDNTDGAHGLIVLGNLHAKNIAIGGQETYVRGDLIVEELLCGSYNHGEMKVDGSVRAKLLISDYYRFWIKGTLDAAIGFTDCERVGMLDGCDYDDEFDYENNVDGKGYGGARWVDGYVPLQIALDEACLDEDDSDSPFMFAGLVSLIAQGRSPFLPAFLASKQDFSKLKAAAKLYGEGCKAASDDEYDRAIKLLKAALASGFPAHLCHFAIADALYNSSDYDASLPHWSVAIDANCREAECRVKRGSSFIQLDDPDYDAASADFAWVKENTSEYIDREWRVEALQQQGSSLRLRDLHEQAIPFYQEALELDDEHTLTLGNLARSLQALEREAEALPFALRAMEIDPDPRYTLFVLAECQAATGDINRAIESCVQHQAHDPEWLYGWLLLTKWYLAQDKKAEAKKTVKKALALDPENEFARLLSERT